MKPEDEGDYTFVPDGHAFNLSAKLNFMGNMDAFAFTLEKVTQFIVSQIKCYLTISHFLFFLAFPEVKIDFVPRQGTTNFPSSCKPVDIQGSVHFKG